MNPFPPAPLARTLRSALLAAALAAGLCSCHRNDPLTEGPPVVPVSTAAISNLANDLVVTAEFAPYQDIEVMSKVAGFTQSIRVDIGDPVKAGDILAVLEVPEIADEVSKAEAGVQAAEAAARIARLSFERLRDVAARERNLVPQQDLDVAKSRDLDSAAHLASAQSALRSAQAMMAYATIRAPFSGVVTRRYADVGAMIQAGISSQSQAMPVVRLAQLDPLRLVLPVPVSAVPAISVGQPVDVMAAGVGATRAARITRLAESVDPATRTMRAEVDLPNPDHTLLPGMYAHVRLHLAAHPGALSVPLDAVDGIGTAAQQAYLVRNGTVHLVRVTTGIQTSARVEILSGLSRGDQVIVGRHGGLYEGEKVDPRPAAYEDSTGA